MESCDQREDETLPFQRVSNEEIALLIGALRADGLFVTHDGQFWQWQRRDQEPVCQASSFPLLMMTLLFQREQLASQDGQANQRDACRPLAAMVAFASFTLMLLASWLTLK